VLPSEKRQRIAIDPPADFVEEKFYGKLIHVPTSNIVERLFSQAKLYLSPLRKIIHPKQLESMLFLKSNRSYWNITTLVEATDIKNDEEEEKEMRESSDEENF
jgi:hypothetical protein